ncbi:hypothetical protein K501DRAFT_184937 [Backusella circina FSU 941]|nr:hypothetical protein K501DRAFT_184937 [Backusella circina FSU 941]
MDKDYLEGATIKTACHKLPNSKKEGTAGRWGTPGEQCDAPTLLARETIKWIANEWRDKLDFVIWTGDNAKHDWDRKHKRKRRHVYDLNQYATDMMMDAFWPRHGGDPIPIIPTLGNNDVYPHNQMATDESELLSFYEQLWRPWIPQNQRETFRQGGYYKVSVGDRMSVITLNTMYFYTKNDAVRSCRRLDSAGYTQLVWFQDQLKAARLSRERIYVMGHIPPSPRDYMDTCLSEYLRLAGEYSDVIMGQFFAHLNMDHFLLYDGREMGLAASQPEMDVHINRDIDEYVDWLRSMYQNIDPLDDKNAPQGSQRHVVVVQVAPSVLPVYYPGFRIYKYELNDDDEDEDDYSKGDYGDDEDDNDDDDDKPYGTLLGYSQYFSNLTRLNEIDAETLHYELEYTTWDAYGMTDLTIESYFELAKQMVEDDSSKGNDLWTLYRRHMLVSTQNFSSDPFEQ